MLSRDLIRHEPERVRGMLAARRMEGALLDRWLALDADRRARLVEIEDLKQQRNTASKEIGRIKGQGGDASAQIAAVSEIKEKIGALEGSLGAIDEELAATELGLPNLLHETVPEGADADANREERHIGEPRHFDFEPQAHWDLGPALGILDFERGAKLAGARFTAYRGAGARLERALIQLMLDLHTREHGYVEVLPPFIANRESLTATGQLPKFEVDLFKLEGQEYFLIPTAEVPLTNLHRGETLDEGDLPVRYTAYTPCFRAEAGSYGKDVRGLIRQHQFNKVELVWITAQDASWDALETLTGHAETVLQRLELPYRVVALSTGDIGFSAAKTYDLEVWLPGQSAYREISSCSNFEGFQARRMQARWRNPETGKPEPVHTLNGSGVAVGRALIAVLENYQQADGSVTVPDALRPYLGGLERLTAP